MDLNFNRAWRRSRLAARLLLEGERRSLSPLRKRAAEKLLADKGVTNRLIQHGLDFLRGRIAQRAHREA